MEIMKRNGQWGVHDWASGFRAHKEREQTLIEEAAKSAEGLLAVVNRLLRQGKEEEAEEIWDMLA